MCSIIGFTKKTLSPEEIAPYFDRTLSRGPDMTRFEETATGYLGFHRLAIMGLTPEGMQSFHLGGDMAAGPRKRCSRKNTNLSATPTARSSCPCTGNMAFPCSPCWMRSLPC